MFATLLKRPVKQTVRPVSKAQQTEMRYWHAAALKQSRRWTRREKESWEREIRVFSNAVNFSHWKVYSVNFQGERAGEETSFRNYLHRNDSSTKEISRQTNSLSNRQSKGQSDRRCVSNGETVIQSLYVWHRHSTRKRETLRFGSNLVWSHIEASRESLVITGASLTNSNRIPISIPDCHFYAQLAWLEGFLGEKFEEKILPQML